MRFLVYLLLFALAVIVRPPASLIDAALDRYSDGGLRLAESEGTLWHGAGSLEVIDPVTQRWQPWQVLHWDTDASPMWRGAVVLHLGSADAPLADIEVGIAGIRVTRLQLRGPARYFLERIPGPLGHAGWSGDIALDAADLRCNWAQRCDGRAELRWNGCSSELLQQRRLGDYHVAVDAKPAALFAHVDTSGGDVQVEGDGRWDYTGAPSFKGTLRGDPVLLDRLPNIAGRWVRSGGEPGVWLVTVP